MSTEAIRKSHLESLRKNNFEFYKQFYNRQKNNTPTTADLQAQLGYHKDVRFSLAELKAIARIKNCLLNIKNKIVKDQLWKAFEQKKEYQDNPKLHLDAIRKELMRSENALRKSTAEDDKKSFQDLIKLLFNIRWELGIPLLIDEASFCLDYEIILAITNIVVKAKDLTGFQRDIEDQMEDHELAIELKLQEELWKEASFKRLRQLKADQKAIEEEGFIQIQKERDVHQSEKEYKEAKKMMGKYNDMQKGPKKYTLKTEKLLNKAIEKYHQSANKGHQKSQDKLKDLQKRHVHKGNPDQQTQQWIINAVRKVVADYNRTLPKFIKQAQEKKEYLHLADLIVMELDPKIVPTKIEWGGISPERSDIRNKILHEDSTNSSDDSADLTYELSESEGEELIEEDTNFIFGPLFTSGKKKYNDVVMAIDPSGEGKDETTYCIAKRSDNYYFVVEVDGIGGGYIFENSEVPPRDEILDLTLQKLASVAKKHKVNNIHLEINGASTYEKVLKDALKKLEIGYININTHYSPTKITKEERILNTLLPIVQEHRLIIDKQAFKVDCSSKQTKDLYYKFFYQFMTIHKYKLTSRVYFDLGNPKHDDRIDVVASAINCLQERKDAIPRILKKRELRDRSINPQERLTKKELETLQKQNNLIDKVKLAIIYKEGLQGIRKNYKEARRLLEETLVEEPSNLEVLKHLAEIYKYGLGTEENVLKAYKLYKTAFRQKEDDAKILFELADILKKIAQNKSKTNPITKFYYKAVGFLERAAALVYPAAQYKLAKILFKDSKKTDKTKARKLLDQAANSGYQKAQYKKAERYFTFIPNESDRNLEIDWLQEAAAIEKNSKPPKFGVAKAQLALGNWYYYHEENFEEAFKYYLLASNMYTEAKEKLASMYYEGKGTEKDYNKSLEFYLQLFTEQEGKLIFYKDWFSQQNRKPKFYDSFTTTAQEDEERKDGTIECRIAKMYELRELHKLNTPDITKGQALKFYKTASEKGSDKARQALHRLDEQKIK